MYVSVKPGVDGGAAVAKKVSAQIEKEIGKIARPKNVWIVADMPKTRSGKIMRRVIASISNFADIGDVTTLANPEIVEQINEQVRAEKVARGDGGLGPRRGARGARAGLSRGRRGGEGTPSRRARARGNGDDRGSGRQQAHRGGSRRAAPLEGRHHPRRMVKNLAYERLRRSKALQRADPGEVPTGPPTCVGPSSKRWMRRARQLGVPGLLRMADGAVSLLRSRCSHGRAGDRARRDRWSTLQRQRHCGRRRDARASALRRRRWGRRGS